MILYHGSYTDIINPDLTKSRLYTDCNSKLNNKISKIFFLTSH